MTRNEQKIDTKADAVNKMYSLSLTSDPLSTLSVSLVASRNENEPGDGPDMIRQGYSLYTTAQLYEDLWGSLNSTYSTVEKGTGDDSFSNSLRLTARLRPTLLLNYDGSYNRNLDTNDYGFNNTATLNWRLSYILNINSAVNVMTSNNADTEKSLRLTMNLTPSYKHRLATTYALKDDGREISHLYSANWHYVITRVFSFQLNGNYFNGEDDSTWSFFARLNAQYRNN